MSNGDEKLFKQLEDSYGEIGELLKKDRLNSREVMKKFLATNQLIMAFFIGSYLEDHKKVEVMWATHKIIIFISGAFGLSLIALIWGLLTGQAEITIK